jgi:hypothetical protein
MATRATGHLGFGVFIARHKAAFVAWWWPTIAV